MSIHKHKNGWVFRKEVWRLLPDRAAATAYGNHVASALAAAERGYSEQVEPCCRIRDKLDEFLTDSLAEIGRRPCNKQTARLHRKRLLVFDQAFHSTPLDCIDRAALERWIKRRLAGGVMPDTVNADMVSLRSFSRWAQKKGYAPALLPFLAVGRLMVKGKLPGTNRNPPKALEISEMLTIVARVKNEREDVGLLLEGMILFCLRPGAVAKLRRRDLILPVGNSSGRLENQALKGFFDRSLVILPGSEQHVWANRCLALAKKKRRRALRPNEPLVIHLGGCSKRNPGGWTTDSLDRVLAGLCRNLGIKFTSYQIRHSVISWLQENPRLSPATVQAAAAHSRIETQNTYGKRRGDEAAPAFKILSNLMRQGPTTTAPEGKGGDVSPTWP